MENSIDFNTDWRKVASTIYKKPTDSKVFGSVELDVTDMELFVTEKRRTGLKITLTHLMVLIVARALQTTVPELNTYLRRGKIVHRHSIDAMVSVLQADGQMGSIKVPSADAMNLQQLAGVMAADIQKSRHGNENKTMKSKGLLSSVPWPFRSWLFAIYRTVTINWGFSVPLLGLKTDSFGSFVITNIGSIGLETGFPALLPSSNLAFVLVMGGINKKPVVVNDEIVIRRIMSLSIVMDHRLVDASHGGKLFRFIKYMIKNPQELE